MATFVKPNFKPGLKEIFLPKASLTLLRTPLGANFAKFRVPLNFSKLDLRDYLWHGYGVATLNIRSYVKQQRVIQGDPRDPRPTPRRWHRAKAHKHMTVELERPFVYPEEPEDYSAWNKTEVEMTDKEQRDKSEKEVGTLKDTLLNKDRREMMKEQARELLEGRRKWIPPAPGKLGIERVSQR